MKPHPPAIYPSLVLAAVSLITLLLGVAPARADLKGGDFQQFGLLAIQENGRRKPVDTFAKESLLRLSGSASYKDSTGHVWVPSEFLLSMLPVREGADPASHDWRKEPIILINYHPLAEKLGLDSSRRRFSFEELTKLPDLKAMADEVHELQRQSEKPEFNRMQQEVRSVMERMMLFNNLSSGAIFLIVPPPAPAPAEDAWLLPPDAATAYGEQRFDPAADHLRSMVGAYLSSDAFKFQSEARQLRESLRALRPDLYPSEDALALEYRYNHLHAFGWAASLYALGLILLATSSLPSNAARFLRTGGIVVALGGLAFHATGIAIRCIIAGRPPVTNMFESIVWVSFVVIALGFIFFLRYRAITYLCAALPVSMFAVFLALNASVAMPESIDPLQPVLRDNFWLTIHVLTETASYGAFALGMGFGHILLFRYLIDPETARAESALHFWLYRILQLGVLLIAVGTILGAFWANYSWGRYWGWDPKETWALITLLCYIVAIHGRIAGVWGQFGLAVASVICFNSVLMAWYGVNFVLGKGLHSYGFGVGGGEYVAAIITLDMLFLAAVIWRRHQSEARRRRQLLAADPAIDAPEDEHGVPVASV